MAVPFGSALRASATGPLWPTRARQSEACWFTSSDWGRDDPMRAVVTVGVISAVPVALMIRSAVASGFAVFVAPIGLAELLLLGAVYLIWRGL